MPFLMAQVAWFRRLYGSLPLHPHFPTWVNYRQENREKKKNKGLIMGANFMRFSKGLLNDYT